MNRIDFNLIEKNLRILGYCVSCFDTSTKAVEYLNMQMDNKIIGFGGSMTLEQMNLYDVLSKHNKVFWHHRIPDGETSNDVRLKANAAEIYISSVNGLAQTGEIINIDSSCNRVSAIFYGHEKVYLVVGKNKIAYDYDSALYRARNIAAPQNAKRLGVKTPCAKNADRCYNCKSPDRICRGLSVLWGKPMTGEFEIILVNENLGF